MQKALSTLLQICLYALGFSFTTSQVLLAQVTPDNSVVDTQVTQDGNIAEITGGQTSGGNLFHSFQDFSVQTGNEAFFNNANDISNILSRVTGGNISNIDGLIRANGSASLFLINPAGIIFGGGARLDIGGSFYSSTASSILFEDGEFSAADLENPPLLTVNAPIGLGFRNEPGDIVNRSIAGNSEETVGLEVSPGNSITLLGGNINLDAGNITAKGGRIELGSLFQAGTVDLAEDGSLNFPENINKADITLSNFADVDVTGTGGGNITINARNFNLEAEESGSSSIRAGIISESDFIDTQAGDIIINTTGNITLDNSVILNQVSNGGVGNSGNIKIATASMFLTNGAGISASTLGQGNAGNIVVDADQNLVFNGENSLGLPSGIGSLIGIGATGNAGGVTISTDNLTLTNGGQVSATTLGTGNAGLIDITATDIIMDGTTSGDIRFRSSINSAVDLGAIGNAGGVTVATDNLTLTNGGEISASTLGTGDAGDITINAMKSTFISGIAEGNRSGISANALNTNGNGGNINIFGDRLLIENGGKIEASNFDSSNIFSPGTGLPGNINIKVNSISLVNMAGIDAATQSETGIGGVIDLQVAEDITLRENSFISAEAVGEANGGNLNIDAEFIIAFPGNNSDIIADAERGQGGNIEINATLFGIEERPLDPSTNDISASSKVIGLDGNVTINSLNSDRLSKSRELPRKIVQPEQTTAQTCQANREAAAKNRLNIAGKGGIPSTPDSVLDSRSILIDSKNTDSISAIPEPIETSQGKIRAAGGVKVTESGEVILTAYRTSSADNRLPAIKRNCS